jgi:hypothetical protein
MRLDRKQAQRLVLALLTASLCLPGAGCLWVAVGAGAGAAVAGYAWWRGRIYRDYPNPLQQTAGAASVVFADQRLPILHQETDADSASFEVEVPDGNGMRKMLVDVSAQPRPQPGDPPVTRVSVRVDTFGHEEISQRILDSIGVQLLSQPPPNRLQPQPVPGALPGTPVPATPVSGPVPATTSDRLVPQANLASAPHGPETWTPSGPPVRTTSSTGEPPRAP